MATQFAHLPREIIDYILELALPLCDYYLIDKQRNNTYLAQLAARLHYDDQFREWDKQIKEKIDNNKRLVGAQYSVKIGHIKAIIGISGQMMFPIEKLFLTIINTYSHPSHNQFREISYVRHNYRFEAYPNDLRDAYSRRLLKLLVPKIESTLIDK